MIFGEPEPGEPIKKAIDSVDFHFALVIVIRMEQDRLRAWVLALERGPSGNVTQPNTLLYAWDTSGQATKA